MSQSVSDKGTYWAVLDSKKIDYWSHDYGMTNKEISKLLRLFFSVKSDWLSLGCKQSCLGENRDLFSKKYSIKYCKYIFTKVKTETLLKFYFIFYTDWIMTNSTIHSFFMVIFLLRLWLWSTITCYIITYVKNYPKCNINMWINNFNKSLGLFIPTTIITIIIISEMATEGWAQMQKAVC